MAANDSNIIKDEPVVNSPADDVQGIKDEIGADKFVAKPFKPEAIENDVYLESDLTEKSYAELVEDPGFELDYAKKMKDEFVKQQLHQIALAKLQTEEYAVERQQFYNEVSKVEGLPRDEKAVSAYIENSMDANVSARILRDVAPSAYTAAQDAVKNYDLNSDLEAAGIDQSKITQSLREELQLSGAHASAIGGVEGKNMFLEALGNQKDNIMKGLGDPKVSLAISGAMLGATVMAASNPIGITIAGLKFASNLLKTEKGQKFQETVKQSSMNFLEKMGVPREFMEKTLDKANDVIDKAATSRVGKYALVGLGAAAIAVGISSQIDFPNLEGKSLGGVVEVAKENIEQGLGGIESSSLSAELAELKENISTTTYIDAADQVAEYALNKALDAGSAAYESVSEMISTPEVDHLAEFEARFEDGGVPSSELFARNGVNPPLPSEIQEHMEAADVAAVQTGQVHLIQSGETLSGISEKMLMAQGIEDPSATQIYNTVNSIVEINGIENPDLIYPNQQITLPEGFEPNKLEAVGAKPEIDPATPIVMSSQDVQPQAEKSQNIPPVVADQPKVEEATPVVAEQPKVEEAASVVADQPKVEEAAPVVGEKALDASSINELPISSQDKAVLNSILDQASFEKQPFSPTDEFGQLKDETDIELENAANEEALKNKEAAQALIDSGGLDKMVSDMAGREASVNATIDQEIADASPSETAEFEAFKAANSTSSPEAVSLPGVGNGGVDLNPEATKIDNEMANASPDIKAEFEAFMKAQAGNLATDSASQVIQNQDMSTVSNASVKANEIATEHKNISDASGGVTLTEKQLDKLDDIAEPQNSRTIGMR